MPAQGCAIQPGPLGDIGLIPVRGGHPMTPEEVERLSEAQHQDLEQRQHLVLQELRAVTQQQRQLMEQLATEIRQVERAMSTQLIAPLIAALQHQHPQEHMHHYLEAVQAHMVEPLDRFKAGGP